MDRIDVTLCFQDPMYGLERQIGGRRPVADATWRMVWYGLGGYVIFRTLGDAFLQRRGIRVVFAGIQTLNTG